MLDESELQKQGRLEPERISEGAACQLTSDTTTNCPAMALIIPL